MIVAASTTDIVRLLDGVSMRPDRYRGITLCSPFIDNEIAHVIVRLAKTTSSAGCGLSIFTTPRTAIGVRALLPTVPMNARLVVQPVEGLHAKFYIAVGRSYGDSSAIITSANLTRAGLSTNVELGVRALPSSRAGRTLIATVAQFALRLRLSARGPSLITAH